MATIVDITGVYKHIDKEPGPCLPSRTSRAPNQGEGIDGTLEIESSKEKVR